MCVSFSSSNGTNWNNFIFWHSGCSVDQRPVCTDTYSSSLSKKRDYFLSEHFDLCSSTVLMQLPNASLHHGSSHQQSDRRPSMEEGEANTYRRPHECLSPSNTFMGRSKLRYFSQRYQVPSVLWSDLFTSFTQAHLGKLHGGRLRTYTQAAAHLLQHVME